MSGPSAIPGGDDPWRPRHNPWLIAVVVAMAAFMEVLDTSIANVALPYMAGNLGASNDESTWVLTSYLVSNAIVLPISGWLAVTFGRKRFFMVCLVIFTLSSLLCGIAPSLGLLLLFRVLQGAGGGGLQPMAQAILADTFPPQKRGLAFALYGITAVMAPTIGPTLGGWITFNYSWRWIFFINLPVGILALFLVFRPGGRSALLCSGLRPPGVRLDYLGIALLALGVGALQILLDKGQEDDWFGSRFIVTLMVIAAVCLVSLVIWEWFSQGSHHRRASLQELQLRERKSHDVLLWGFFCSAAWSSCPSFSRPCWDTRRNWQGWFFPAARWSCCLPCRSSANSRPRYRPATSLPLVGCCLALAMYYSTQRIDLPISFSSATWLRIAQVFGLGFLFVPITLVAYVGIPPEKSNVVAGMINFMRNIGSSVGTSMVTTLIARRSQFHQTILVGHITPGNQNFQNLLGGLAQRSSIPGRFCTDRRPGLTRESIRRCRPRRLPWPISIPLRCLPWERRSCSYCLFC